MVQLYIENNELDLSEGFTNQITYSVDDLENLDSKTTSFSKTIVVPGTTRNNKLLGNIFEFANNNFYESASPNVNYNFNASVSAKARLDVNGVTIIKGVLRLLEIIIDGQRVEYEMAIFGELGGFVSKVGNKRIEDIYLDNYNHIYSVANIQSSWNNANNGYGYYYPLIDIGAVSTDKKNYQYKAFRPALFVREIIDKIITDAGYTWESNFFNTDFFKRLILPYNEKALTKRGATNYVDAHNTSSQHIYGTDIAVEPKVIYQSSTLNNFSVNGANTIFTYTGASAINTTITAQFVGTYNLSRYCSLYLQVYLGGNVISQTGYTYGSGNIALNVSGNYTINPGDTLYVVAKIVGNTRYGFTYDIYLNTSTLSVIPNGTTFVEYQLGDTIEISRIIPKNIFQKDFFASILKMFYLMVTEDKLVDRKLIIEPWVDFYDLDRTSYLDFTNKIDRSNVIKLKPMSEINARYYQIKYKSDTDFYNDAYKKRYNEGYGDVIYDNNLEFAKETSTTEVLFAATPLVGYTGEDKIVSTTFKKSGTTEEAIDIVPRILQAKKITGVSSWNILNSSTILASGTTYAYAGHFDDPDVPAADINFGALRELFFDLSSGALSNTLFNTYYSSYLAEITDKDSRLFTAKMKLTEQDIYNLDFGKFVFVDGVLYRLNKIIDYSAGDLCTVELLRVIYTTY